MGSCSSCLVNRYNNFAFIRSILDESECQDIIKSAGKLGIDATSKDYTKRYKNIGLMVSVGESWYRLDQDYVEQHSNYNDSSSGGIRRYFTQFPKDFPNNPSVLKVLNEFKKNFTIPDERIVLVQVQTSHVGKDIDCLTGQGIHTDGQDVACVTCLHHGRNVKGARSAIFADKNGKDMILGPRALKPGEGLFFTDNKTYHYVEPAWCDHEDDSSDISARVDHDHDGHQCDNERTVMLMHYPAWFVPKGEVNPNNSLLMNECKHPEWSCWWQRENKTTHLIEEESSWKDHPTSSSSSD